MMYMSKRQQPHQNENDSPKPPMYLLILQLKDAGMAQRKWLLVNVQNVQEFVCQALNRDVWSNSSAKAVIKEHFVFWQVGQLVL